MANLPVSNSALPLDRQSLEQAFKEFSLETERLELTYRSLNERFKSVQSILQDSHTRLSGKLAELDFLSRYLEAILNHMSQGIIFIDLKGIVTTYNAAAQQLLQISEKELLFHPFTDFFDDAFFGFSLQNAFMTKKSPSLAITSIVHNEQSLELEVEATFVVMGQQSYSISMAQSHMPSSSIQGLLILFRDVTKIQRLQQLAARHDRLKELGELAAHVAHEIRNPLGGIRGFATLLQQELKDRLDLQQMASYIVEGADDLNYFVTCVLQYARPFQPHFESVDLVSLIDEIRQLVQADSAWNSTITFCFHCSVSTLFVRLDPQLFKSALLNLFVNAIQAMPNGGELTVELIPSLSEVLLKIQDTGIGIAQENLAKLFSPFFTTKQTGNGLGLTEVHKVVQAHYGTIEVESEAGKGTLFIIKIPLKLGES